MNIYFSILKVQPVYKRRKTKNGVFISFFIYYVVY